jgi:hypothetical protein
VNTYPVLLPVGREKRPALSEIRVSSVLRNHKGVVGDIFKRAPFSFIRPLFDVNAWNQSISENEKWDAVDGHISAIN